MKNLSIIFIAFFLLQISILAQAPDTLWTKVYGGNGNDWGYTVEQTSDDGYIIVGHTNSFSSGDIDVWLLKTDSYGDTIWSKTIGGGQDDQGWCVKQTVDGGYIISGHTESFGAGEEDLWLVKTNDSGDTSWTKTYGGFDDDKFFNVIQTSDQGYIVLGQTRSFGEGEDDLWLLKTDANGDTLWTKTFGDSLDNEVGAAEPTIDGGYILTGTTEMNTMGEEDIWLIKTNQFGDIEWTKTIGGSESERISPNSIEQTTDGGYIIFSSTSSYGAGGEDIWLIKTDINGDTLWTKTFGGIENDVSICGHQTSEGGYIILARTDVGLIDVWLIKTDSNGNINWTTTLGGIAYDIGMTVQQNTDNGYIIAGATESFGTSGMDLWLICTEIDSSTTSIANSKQKILSFVLKQNYPNPFNPTTKIKYQIPEISFVTLKVYDVLGNEIETLVDDEKPAGIYEIKFDGSGLPSGIYFCRMQTENFHQTMKMVLNK